MTDHYLTECHALLAAARAAKERAEQTANGWRCHVAAQSSQIADLEHTITVLRHALGPLADAYDFFSSDGREDTDTVMPIFRYGELRQAHDVLADTAPPIQIDIPVPS